MKMPRDGNLPGLLSGITPPVKENVLEKACLYFVVSYTASQRQLELPLLPSQAHETVGSNPAKTSSKTVPPIHPYALPFPVTGLGLDFSVYVLYQPSMNFGCIF